MSANVSKGAVDGIRIALINLLRKTRKQRVFLILNGSRLFHRSIFFYLGVDMKTGAEIE